VLLGHSQRHWGPTTDVHGRRAELERFTCPPALVRVPCPSTQLSSPPFPPSAMTEERSLLGESAHPALDWGRAGGGSPGAGAASALLRPGVLQVLQFVPPQSICRVARVNSVWALAARSDVLWERLLAQDWAAAAADTTARAEEVAALAELQQRVKAEARARRGPLLADLEADARRRSIVHAGVPTLNAGTPEASPPSAPQSPEQLRALQDAKNNSSSSSSSSVQLRRSDECIPRVRSIATLNTLLMPPGTSASSSGKGPDRSPRPALSPTLQQHQLQGKTSPDSGDSGSDLSVSPLKRAYTEGANYPTPASAFNFPSPAAVAAVFSPRPPSQASAGSRFAAQRYVAPPDSLKAIFADVMQKSYPRFALRPHLAVGERLPRTLKFVAIACALLALTAGVSLCYTDPGNFAEDTPFYRRPRILSLMCTLSGVVALALLFLNLVRVLRRSLLAKQALWKLPPIPPPDASMAEHEHAAAVSAFQLADQVWWRGHTTNRWHAVRYQVWLPPSTSLLLVLATGQGAFLLLWCIITLSLGSWWQSAGVGIGMLFPGAALIIAFQLGRMLRISRTLHLINICSLSLMQLCTLVYLLHAGNPCLVWQLDYSLALGFAALAGSFAPNLLLLFFALWLHEDYITHGFDAAVLPPQLPVSLDFESPEAVSPTARADFNSRSPAFGAPAGAGVRDEESQMPVYAIASATSAAHWAAMFIPPAHTFGRVLLGSRFERRWIESRIPLSVRKALCSRVGLSVLGGCLIYAATCTYWSSLFRLFLDPRVVFPLLPAAVRWFHVLSLASFLLVSVIVTLIVVFASLQNRSWLWWWYSAHVNAAALLLIGLHYAFWSTNLRAELREALLLAQDHPMHADAFDQAAVRLRMFESQLSTHWLYSCSSWLALLCCVTALSLVASVLCMRLLYRPKSVRELLKSAAEAAVAEAEEEAVLARRMSIEHDSAACCRAPFLNSAAPSSTVVRAPMPTPIIPPPLSNRYAPQVSASPVLIDSLSTLAMSSPGYDPARLGLGFGGYGIGFGAAPMSFFQSLQQPASPAVDLQDHAFHEQLRDIRTHAQEQQQRLQFPDLSSVAEP